MPDIMYFNSRANADAASNIPASVDNIILLGYYGKHDGGGGIYKRVSIEPLHGLKFDATNSPDPINWWEFVGDSRHISLLQAGARGDGVTDDRDAFQNCIEFLNITGKRVLLIPSEKNFLIKTASNKSLLLANGNTVRGEDRWTSKIKFDDSGGGDHLFKGNDLSNLKFQNFTIEGRLVESGYSQGNAHFFSGSRWTDILFEDMHLTRNRAVMINLKGADGLRFRRNRIFHNKGGGLVARDAYNVWVAENEFFWCRDDPVAIGQNGDERSNSPGFTGGRTAGGSIVVANNHCIGSRSLNVLGAKRVWNRAPTIEGNAGSRYMVLGWQRMTTGASHAADTDWRELRTLTGT